MKRYPLGLALAVMVAGGVPALASGASLRQGVHRAFPAAMAPGDLDVSFSDDGRQTTDFGGADAAAAVAVQADGKIVVAGSSGGNFALARYGADGALDPSFSGDGLVTTDLGGTDDGQGVAIQADGKIVVAGGSGGNFALARYTAGGALDASFSGDGLQTTDFGAADGGTAVAIQPDGRIVVAGGSGGDFALARYDAQGALDTSFSGDGKQTTDFGGFDTSNDIAIRADGAVVAVGTLARFDRTADYAVARYSAGGALDPTFSFDGKEVTDFGLSSATYDSAESVAIQADGRIVVAGYGAEQDQFGGYNRRDIQLARYEAGGALDTSFGGGGRVATRAESDTFGYGVTLEGNGRMVAVGKSAGAFALARFNIDGTLDGTFSDDGMQNTGAALAGANEVGVDGVLQADGKLVVVGTAAGAGGVTDFVLARFHGDTPEPNPGPNTPDTRINGGESGRTNVNTPSHTFTATLAGSTFECKLDGPGAATGTYTSCASPKAYGTLTDGRYTFSVRATRSGITDPTPATRPFTVDTVAPTVSLDAAPVGSTTDGTPLVEFSSNEPGSFECRLDTVEFAGFFQSCTSPLNIGPLAGGVEYAVWVRAIDTAGNASPPETSGLFVVDGSAPNTWIDDGPAAVTTATESSFTFHATLGGSTFECQLDRPTGAGSYTPCSSPQTYTTTETGAYMLSVRATSNGQTDESPITWPFMVVATNAAPTAQFTHACSGLVCYLDADGSLDSDGTIADYAWDFGDGAPANGRYVRKVFSQYGTYEFRLRVTDNAGAGDTRAETISLLRLTGQVSMVGGFPQVTATWNGNPGTVYWVYRGSKRVGIMMGTTFVDRPPFSALGTYSYAVCEWSGPMCSATETLRLP